MAVVLAGGKGSRLGPLTQHVCKPALPFGAAYRNIDFTLSNCVNSGIRRIGIPTQYQPGELLQHLDEVWRNTAKAPYEFLEAWPAEVNSPDGGYRGTADAVYRNLSSIRRAGPQLALVLAGDHVYQMDYRPMLEYHRRRNAQVTVGCVEIRPSEASQFGVLSSEPDGRIERFVEKPKRIEEFCGERVLASMGIYVFDADFLDATLRQDAFSIGSKHDFGCDILPRLVADARLYAYPFTAPQSDVPGYWRDVGTPAAYWRAHMDLLERSSRLRLGDRHWPMPCPRGTPRFTSQDGRSLIASGSRIEGSVSHSVLFADVHVSRCSTVERSVILPGAAVGRNCRLHGVIVGTCCRIPDGMLIDARLRWKGLRAADEPVVVTQEDFAPALVASNA